MHSGDAAAAAPAAVDDVIARAEARARRRLLARQYRNKGEGQNTAGRIEREAPVFDKHKRLSGAGFQRQEGIAIHPQSDHKEGQGQLRGYPGTTKETSLRAWPIWLVMRAYHAVRAAANFMCPLIRLACAVAKSRIFLALAIILAAFWLLDSCLGWLAGLPYLGPLLSRIARTMGQATILPFETPSPGQLQLAIDVDGSGVIDSVVEGLTPSRFIFPYGEDIQDGVSYLCAAPARAVASSHGDVAAGIIAEAFAGGLQGHFGPKDTTWDSFWDGTKEAAASMNNQADEYLDRVTDNVLMLFRGARTISRDLSRAPASDLVSSKSWSSLCSQWLRRFEVVRQLWRSAMGARTEDDGLSRAQILARERLRVFGGILEAAISWNADVAGILGMGPQAGAELERRLCTLSRMLQDAAEVGEARLGRAFGLGSGSSMLEPSSSSSWTMNSAVLGRATHLLREYEAIGSVLCTEIRQSADAFDATQLRISHHGDKLHVARSDVLVLLGRIRPFEGHRGDESAIGAEMELGRLVEKFAEGLRKTYF